MLKEQLEKSLADFNQNNERLSIIIARHYLRLGENQKGLDWLELTLEGPRTHWHPYLNVDPVYDNVRDDPRFKTILQRMKLW